METIRKIEELECRAIDMLNCGKWSLDSDEGGALADEIKDLAEAKKDCWKAKYYEAIVKAMESPEEPRYGEAAGYDNWRYSSGKFAPTGRGHRSGFMPMSEDWVDPEYIRAGMTPHNMSSNRGTAYDNYQNAKRHYHETKDPNSKAEMDNRTLEYTQDAIGTFRDMWRDADPAMRKKMKMDLSNLVGEMAV